jgi:hypothetical protein
MPRSIPSKSFPIHHSLPLFNAEYSQQRKRRKEIHKEEEEDTAVT